MATASLGNLFVAVQDAERETVAKFAAFTHTTLNMPVLELVADFIGAVWDSLQPRDGSTVTRGNAADLTEDDRSEDGQQGASRDTQALVKQLSGVPASAGRRRRRNDDSHQPYLNMLRDGYRSAEADLREMAGDNRGAAQVMQAEFAREALSSNAEYGLAALVQDARQHVQARRGEHATRLPGRPGPPKRGLGPATPRRDAQDAGVLRPPPVRHLLPRPRPDCRCCEVRHKVVHTR